MEKVLHILPSEPDNQVFQLIESISGQDGVTVAVLYQDRLNPDRVDWFRLVDDIFAHDKIICWW